jgi:hypothetical protein
MELFPERAQAVFEMAREKNPKLEKVKIDSRFIPGEKKVRRERHQVTVTLETPDLGIPEVTGFGDEISKKMATNRAYAALLVNYAFYRVADMDIDY